VTTVLEMVPLVALYELSILLLRGSERRRPTTAAQSPRSDDSALPDTA
jgi:Sec-independent protein secretion pathway component TatC